MNRCISSLFSSRHSTVAGRAGKPRFLLPALAAAAAMMVAQGSVTSALFGSDASSLPVLRCLSMSQALAQPEPGSGRRFRRPPEGNPPQPGAQPGQKDEGEGKGKPKEEDKNAWTKDLVQTHHTVKIDGVDIAYTATTGRMPIADESGKDKVDIFFIAYTRDGVTDTSTRPITFTFNGGPGSSSVWLHLGCFGPRRVIVNSEAGNNPPPARLADNQYSLLDESDFVFIDPASTGYSRAAEGSNASEFHGASEDVRSVSEFIRLYVTRYKRWDSPKFLAGESYGTTRASALSGYLQDRDGMYLNGIVLISSVLNFQTISFDRGNDLPYILFLPTYTATAWYHHKLSGSLQSGDLKSAVAQAQEFAMGDYSDALFRGDSLSQKQLETVARRYVQLTGLTEKYVLDSNLRVSMDRFGKELLRDERRTIGRYDSRYVGIDSDAAGAGTEYDPSDSAVRGAFTSAINNYLRTELNYTNDLPYEVLTGVWPWSFHSDNSYYNVSNTLRSAITENPSLQVFVACGYYDLATPFLNAIYTINHLGLDPTLQKNVSFGFYESGHMIYLNQPSLAKMRTDLLDFYKHAMAESSLSESAGHSAESDAGH